MSTVAAALLLLVLVTTACFLTGASRHPRQRRRWTSTTRLRVGTDDGDSSICRTSSRTSSITALLDACRRVTAPDNTTQTLINFIALGDDWARRTAAPADVTAANAAQWYAARGADKVPGCMADVRILTSFVPSTSGDGGGRGPTVAAVAGAADSRVAQGILALLADGLRGASCAEVHTRACICLCRSLSPSLTLKSFPSAAPCRCWGWRPRRSAARAASTRSSPWAGSTGCTT